MLVKEPEKRIGVRDKNEIKTHPFFKKLDWKALACKKLISPYRVDPEDIGFIPGIGRSVISIIYYFSTQL